MGTRRGQTERLAAWLTRPVDGASLAAFRVLFGLLVLVAMTRFLLSGWIPRFYGEPTFFFKYLGFSWVEPMPVPGMFALYGVLALCGLAIALGVHTRIAAAIFFVGFTYAELIDVTNYLNHYYLVSMLALLLVFVPAGRAQVPAWALYLVRLQVGVVYVYAGLAKMQPDWLLHAQPLNIWMTARVDTPIIGPLLDETWVHVAASWGAFLFDTTIVLWLSWRRSRPLAYAVLLGFHFMTGVFFNIGMFPAIMTLVATIFFAPDWPRALARRLGRLGSRLARLGRWLARAPQAAAPRAPLALRRAGFAAAGLFVAFQVLFPLRHYLYPGDVLWNEQGMRWAWKVMVREKHGSVTYHVHLPQRGVTVQVPPHRYLTPRQEREMAGQPDLVLQLAHHIADDFRRRGHGQVEVRAEALVSLNGRRARPMIDPAIDLARVADDLAPAAWITPEPDEPPIRLSPQRAVARTGRGGGR